MKASRDVIRASSRLAHADGDEGHSAERRGSALIIALWTIALMSMLVGSFAFDAHIEARITSYYRKRTKAEYLANSGIKISELLTAKSAELRKKKSSDEEEDEEKWWFKDAKRLSEGLAVKGLERNLGEGSIILDIVPEPSRININMQTKEEDLEGIMEVGNIPAVLWPELIESFLDWRDADAIARTDGAETDDYYSTLKPPYEAKNGPLDTVEELLMVKGFNSTILNGGELKLDDEDENPEVISGIKDLLTTYGDGKVNVNAAPKRVLMTLPEVDELVADVILEEREGRVDEEDKTVENPEANSFESLNDFFSRIPELNRKLLEKKITIDSQIFRVSSIGIVQGVKKKVWCILKYSGGKMTILRWREED